MIGKTMGPIFQFYIFCIQRKLKKEYFPNVAFNVHGFACYYRLATNQQSTDKVFLFFFDQLFF